MSEITFKRAFRQSNTLLDKINAYTNELEYSLKLAAGDLGEVRVTVLNFDKDNIILRVIKVKIHDRFFNLGVTNKLSITSSEAESSLQLHNVIQILDEGIIILSKAENNIDLIEDNVGGNKIIRHLSRQANCYKIATKLLGDSITNLYTEERKQRKFDIITDYSKVYYNQNKIYNIDCMDAMKNMGDNSVDFILTDIPYDGVNRSDSSKNRINSKALRVLDKQDADIITFDLDEFLSEVIRITSNSLCIFCGYGQLSIIYNTFIKNNLTARIVVWEKTQFSPMNGDIIYGGNVELAVWGKKHNNGVFNAFCKGTVFKYGSGASKIHPTQKNTELFKEIILDNTNPGMLILDPCIGSGTTAIAAIETGRKFIGFEKQEKWYNVANERISEYIY